MAIRVSRRRFTVEEFHRMAAARVFSEDDRVELLAGAWLVDLRRPRRSPTISSRPS